MLHVQELYGRYSTGRTFFGQPGYSIQHRTCQGVSYLGEFLESYWFWIWPFF